MSRPEWSAMQTPRLWGGGKTRAARYVTHPALAQKRTRSFRCDQGDSRAPTPSLNRCGLIESTAIVLEEARENTSVS